MKLKLTTTLLLSGALLVGCSEMNKEVEDTQDVAEIASADTAVMYGDEAGIIEADGAEILEVDERYWANVDFEAPVITEPTLRGATDVETRRGANYEIYTMDARIMFDLDKATLRSGAEEKLRSIAQSINEISPRGPIRIYGHTDSLASESYNMQLSEDRAETVRDWLQNNTDIAAERMSIEPMGETQPRATNETARGRQLNRRVAIVVATRQDQGQQQGQQQMPQQQQQ
ncbi:MAG: OmpA family protein [Hymenobacteraceae bacterium]|nr:OmpA family protein [Hymenobacteraceae bacterium]